MYVLQIHMLQKICSEKIQKKLLSKNNLEVLTISIAGCILKPSKQLHLTLILPKK